MTTISPAQFGAVHFGAQVKFTKEGAQKALAQAGFKTSGGQTYSITVGDDTISVNLPQTKRATDKLGNHHAFEVSLALKQAKQAKDARKKH